MLHCISPSVYIYIFMYEWVVPAFVKMCCQCFSFCEYFAANRSVTDLSHRVKVLILVWTTYLSDIIVLCGLKITFYVILLISQNAKPRFDEIFSACCVISGFRVSTCSVSAGKLPYNVLNINTLCYRPIYKLKATLFVTMFAFLIAYTPLSHFC